MKTTKEHTPGPWTAEPTDNGFAIRAKAYAEQFAPVRVYSMPGHGPTSEANARLIAAAPELLAACKAAIDCGHLDIDTADRVCAAIAKATA